MDYQGWLTVRETAIRLGLSTVTVSQQLIPNGRLRAVRTKPAGWWLIDPASVEEYMQSRPERYGQLPPQAPSSFVASGARWASASPERSVADRAPRSA